MLTVDNMPHGGRMSRTKKIALFFCIALGFVIVTFCVLVLFLHRIIDLESVKTKATTAISEKTGIAVQADQASLSYFPSLHVTISGVKIHVADNATIHAESLMVYPSLLKLLSGKVEVAAVRIQSPIIAVRIDKEKPPTEIDTKVAELLRTIASVSPSLDMSLRNGVLNLTGEGNAALTVKDIDADADFGLAASEFTVSGNTGFMKRIDISIEVSTKEESIRRVGLSVNANDIDLIRTREAVLPLAGEASFVGTIFSYLRGGNVQVLSFSSHGTTFGELGHLDRFAIRGQLDQGTVVISETGLVFNKVNGTFSMEKGVLSAADMKAELNGGSLKNGALKAALGKGDGPFHFDADISLTAEAAQQLLHRFVKEPAFPLNRLRNLRGMVAGKLAIGESTAALTSWKEKGTIGFDGRIDLAGGPAVDLFLKVMPQRVAIRKLRLQDAQSDATISLDYAEKNINGRYDGTLTTETLARVIRMPELLQGLVRGNISAVIDLEDITKSTVRGRLSLSEVPVLLKEGLQLNIKNMDLRAAPGIFFIDAAAANIGKTDIALRGTIKTGQKDLVIDSDLSADRIDWATVKQLWPQQKGDDRKQRSDGKFPSVGGVIRVSADNFVWDGFTISPFRAKIMLAPERTEISVEDADLCGITMPGSIMLEKGMVDIAFRPTAKDGQLLPVTTCLSDQKSRIRGTFSLNGNLKAGGKAASLVRTLSGDLKFSAQNGSIDKSPAFTRVLEFIDLSEIFSGRIPDIGRERFAYRSITARCDIKNGKLLLRNAVMDAPAFGMAATGSIDYVSKNVDIMLLAAPLSTVDSVINKIPVVKNVTKGSLVAVPVHVSGSFNDLKIRYIPLSSVGSGLLGILERTIKLPVTLFQPSAPAERK